MTPERKNEIWAMLPSWFRRQLIDEYDDAKLALALYPANPRIQAHLAIGSRKFQPVTICNGFISLLSKSGLDHFPIISRIRSVSEDTDNINHREIPFLLLAVPNGADIPLVENLYLIMLSHAQIKQSTPSADRNKVTLCGQAYDADNIFKS